MFFSNQLVDAGLKPIGYVCFIIRAERKQGLPIFGVPIHSNQARLLP